ncbi:RND superfamily putative drug exporter [Geodermatophilus normandii]|uniref:RND superfamily putative drug exporter n=1 Tax=Geodermatophilus normandii TaxID=1137989 RepID=A0A317QG55_9ACTN|nr:MMPL family transporter [Geodermatophilus normandii]PWW21586.1 RND superfamily putative drug exporter [Geodermatophilus normandii]
MFERLGRLVYRRRRWVLALSLALVVFAGIWGTGVFGQMTGGGFDDPGSESSRAAAVAERELGRSAADVVVLYSSEDRTVDDPGYAEAVTSTLDVLPDGVLRVVSFFGTGDPSLVSEDRRSTYAVLTLRGDEDEREDVLDAIEDDLAAPGLTTRLGGDVTLNRDMNLLVSEDIALAETISLPVLAVLLLVVFGSLAAACLPLVIGVTAILGSFAALRAFALVTDVSIFAVNVVTVLGLGLAIDYGLFVVSRFREEVRRQPSIEDALARTLATAGRTVAVSGVTVAVSLAGLLIFPQVFLRSMGFGGMSAVLVAMLAALTLLPALLAVLGPRVDALSIRRAIRRRRRQPAHLAVDPHGTWYRMARAVMRRPVLHGVAVTAFLVVLALPFTRAEFGGIDVRAMPEGAESRVVAETVASDFPPSPAGPVEAIVVLPGAADSPEGGAALESYVAAVDAVPGVDGASVTEAAGSTARVAIASDVGAVGPEGRDLVSAVRGIAAPDGTEVLVGGPSALYADLLDSLGSLLPWMALLVAATLFLLLFLAFGSVVVPVKAMVMNVLSLGASFGALVWIFQDGHLSGVLDFTPTGFVEATSPILVLAIVFGLSMDYEVFLMSRIREQYDLTGDNSGAVATGLQRTGGIITSAALLLVVVIGAFSLSGVVLIKMIGIAMFIAIVIDATIVRTVLVPATMRLLGHANWWAPGPLRRVYARYGIGEHEGPPLPRPSPLVHAG